MNIATTMSRLVILIALVLGALTATTGWATAHHDEDHQQGSTGANQEGDFTSDPNAPLRNPTTVSEGATPPVARMPAALATRTTRIRRGSRAGLRTRLPATSATGTRASPGGIRPTPAARPNR